MNRIMRNWTSLANLTKTRRTIAKNIWKLWQVFLRRHRGSCSSLLAGVGRGISGQIAIMLTLLMVVMLVMILVLVNVGNTSLKATAVTNAADAGALQLGSSLSTKAQMLWESLAEEGEPGDWKLCQHGGLLNIFVAFIVAVVCVVISIVSFGVGSPLALMAIGALAGAIAGGSADWINQGWSAVGAGMLAGAMIGAAVGSCGSLAAPALGGAGAVPVTTLAGGVAQTSLAPAAGTVLTTVAVPVATTTTTTVATTGVVGTVVAAVGDAAVAVYNVGAAVISAGDAALSAVGSWLGTAATSVGDFLGISGVVADIGSFVGSVGGALLGGTPITGPAGAVTTGELLSMAAVGGAVIYKTTVAQNASNQAMRAASEMLSSLSEPDQFREGVFLTVLTQLVDDPLEVQDVDDSDGDGNTTEMVPYFQVWWIGRVAGLKSVNQQIINRINNFWQDEVYPFRDDDLEPNLIPSLKRLGITNEYEDGFDGPIHDLCRGLRDVGQPTSFWHDGPTQTDYEYWESCDPELDPLCVETYLFDHGYDGLDFAIDRFKTLVVKYDAFQEQGENAYKAWYNWIHWFYNYPFGPNYERNQDYSFNGLFNMILNGNETLNLDGGLNDFKTEIENIRDNLDDCTYDTNGVITNPPCVDPNGTYATVDTDTYDEFVPALAAIQEIIYEGEDFQTECILLWQDVDAIRRVGLGLGGINPVIYDWYDAQGGLHTVSVEVSYPLVIPEIVECDMGGNFLSNETCWKVPDDKRSDDGSNTKVRVIREDPAEKEVGILGFWRTGKIERTARASWSRTGVKIQSTSWD